jgi:hypothetical protein
MALIKEIWVSDVQEALNRNADFLPYSVDHSAYIAFGTVHVPQSGSNPTVVKNPATFPLAISERTDTDRTYALNQFALEPTLISNLDELQISYDKRQSVLGQQITTLTQRIGDEVAISWSATGASNIVGTTGSAVATSLAPGATGTRKAVTLADIASLANKLDKDNVPRQNRKLLMSTDMFWELFQISDVIRASYNGFQNQGNVLQTGTVAQLYGFDIMMRPVVSVYANSTTSPKAFGAATATSDNLACIAFHSTSVARALGSMNPLYDSGSNGNGKPEYLGSIFNMEVMLGSAILRADIKGVAALVQTWVS